MFQFGRGGIYVLRWDIRLVLSALEFTDEIPRRLLEAALDKLSPLKITFFLPLALLSSTFSI